MKLSYSKLENHKSFSAWFHWIWKYWSATKGKYLHCWRFCGLEWDIEKKDIGEEHWKSIRGIEQ